MAARWLAMTVRKPEFPFASKSIASGNLSHRPESVDGTALRNAVPASANSWRTPSVVGTPASVLALDARVRMAPADTTGSNRSCTRPYPEELEEWITWNDQPILLRPIKPDDVTEHAHFFDALDAEDIRSRTFMPLRELTPAQLARFTQIDFDREMAFIATRKRESGRCETLGVARCVACPDNERAELGIIVRSDLKHRGLGSILLRKLIDYARDRGIKELFGDTLAENRPAIKFAKQLGFRISRSCDGWTVPLVLTLGGESAAARTS